jgi:hypothetical protein
MIAEETKKFEVPEVEERIKQELARLLRPAGEGVLLWPPDSSAIPDHDPWFRIAYLGPDLASLSEDELQHHVARLIDQCGARRRDYKNALAFAVPTLSAIDRARTGARNVLALAALTDDVRAGRVIIEREQRDDLAERVSSAGVELEGAVDSLYQRLLVPVIDRSADAPFTLRSVDLRAQLATGRDLHQRLLDGLRKQVFDSITPARLVTLAGLGVDRRWLSCEELVSWFFTYLDFPKLLSTVPIRQAIGAGTVDTLGYVAGAMIVEDELQTDRPGLVRFGAPTPIDELDLGLGCFLLSADHARHLVEPMDGQADGRGGPDEGSSAEIGLDVDVDGEPDERDATTGGNRLYQMSATMNPAQFFRILPALQLLADQADRLTLHLGIKAESDKPFDSSWLRNAVEEHFDEAGVERDE